MRWSHFTAIALVVLFFDCANLRAATDNATFFERSVRPVLVEKCLSCHGAKKQEGDLRLDSRSSILQGGDQGPAAVAGQPQTSLLVQAIGYQGDLQMPPDEPLEEKEIAAISRWIELQLPWPEDYPLLETQPDATDTHWAFQPIRKPAIPRLDSDAWSRNPIDRFVLSKLRSAGISPSEQESRHKLIRRATFDLHGLPPTPNEVGEFVADESPFAYDRLIERLLASPRYGERWARHWLDVARYADNKGYVFFEGKKFPWAYTYRDYVIRSFNSDLSYDRFVRQQLAADQLKLGDDRRALTAMGFLTLGGHFMNNTHDIMDDRIDVVTRGLLGLTVTCARCHNHKYDPISQADYYALYGVFRSSYEPMVPPLFETPPETDEYRKFSTELAKREKALVEFVTGKHRELVTDARTRISEYLLAAHARRGVPPADDFMLLTDKGDLNPAMILRWQKYLESPQEPHDQVWALWRTVSSGETVDASLASDQLNPIVRQAFQEEKPQSIEEVAVLYEEILIGINKKWSSIAQTATDSLDDPAEEELRQTLYGRGSPPNAPLALDWGFLSLFPDRPTQAEYKKLIKAVEEWTETGAGAPARAMVLHDAEDPFEPRVFKRGNPNQLGEPVQRQFLHFFTKKEQGAFQNGSGRLELADAVVDKDNPLTARVIVNRIWVHHFGQGLVQTPSDFGLRSDPPSHPVLLDYLAAAFIEQGWSIKELHRQIMTSAVYRQPSVRRDEGIRVDPENRLLWKMNRRRLDFESLRDTVLAVSNNLTTEMHGPPSDLFKSQQNHPRRSIYGFIDRMDVSPLLTTFDFPNPNSSSPQRESTTVPPQSLYWMNNKFVIEAADRLLRRHEVQQAEDRITTICQILFARDATVEEQALCKEFLGQSNENDAWTRIVHGLLMTNEFVFID